MLPFSCDDRKGIWLVKSWVLSLWWWLFDWSFALLYSLNCHYHGTTYIILSSNNSVMQTF